MNIEFHIIKLLKKDEYEVIKMNSKIFMSLFVDIFEHNFFKLEDFLIDEISYFWKLEDDCNTHKKFFLIVLRIVV